MVTPKIWFITGASSGFGLEMAVAALEHGDNVVATLRKPEILNEFRAKYPMAKLLVLKLDVTKEKEIEEAFSKAKEHFGRVDVVFNNAGFVAFGEIEAMSDHDGRAIFETNFWGAANVTRTAVRYLREQKPIGGIILQLSSSVALQANPGAGYYSATKGALESFTEAFAKEVDPEWNIKFSLIEPGPFRTKAVANAGSIAQHPAYTKETLSVNVLRKLILAEDYLWGDTAKAVRQFLKLIDLKEIPFRFPIHKDAVRDARSKGNELTEAGKKWESWSNDVAFPTN